jgi:hypothetical protein
MAQDDGARGYLLVPDGTRAFTIQGIAERSNQSLDPGSVIPDGKLKLRIALLQFTQTFSVGGQQAAAFAVLPVGKVSGSVDLPTGDISGASTGTGDLILGAAVGVAGSPALAPADYMKFRPGFALGVLGKVYVPTGQYDSSKILNLGSNRWAFQLGLPMNYALGKSMVDPALTTFELTPAVMFFTDNKGASQKPLFTIEGHVTHNLSSKLWISADARARFGAETSTDGVSANNAQSAFALGGTVGLSLSPKMQFKATYGGIVAHNKDGPNGHMFRTVLVVVL